MKVHKNYLHVLWRIPALLLWITIMPSLFFVMMLLGVAYRTQLPHIFHQGVQKILGLQVIYSGELSSQKPTLFVSNHISYLDVFVLGEIRAYFIAKSEVASWPVLGQLARFQNTLFFERAAGKAASQLRVMQQHLAEKKSLILFPEGTSTNGTHVVPFKSSLFEAANLGSQGDTNQSVAIQPITVTYTRQAGRPMNQEIRDHYAWYGTMPFGSHFRALFLLKKVEVKVHFHPVCYLEQFDSRKHCAQHCFQVVEQTLNEILSAAE